MLKYQEIKQYLLGVILSPSNVERLPTVRELTKQFNCSLSSVNRALSDLEHEHLIIRHHGSRMTAAKRMNTISHIQGNDQRRNKRILMIYQAYPSELIWRFVYATAQYSALHHLELLQCSINQQTSFEQIMEYIKRQQELNGLIMQMGADVLTDDQLTRFRELPYPVVFFNGAMLKRDFPPNVHVVISDISASARLLAQELIRKGHKCVGYVRNEPFSDVTLEHQTAFVQAMKDFGISVPKEHQFSDTIRSWENSMAFSGHIIEKSLDIIRRDKITALVFTTSQGALAACKVLQRAGLRIPEDISLAGQNDDMYYAHLPIAPAITEVDVVTRVRTSFEILLENFTPKVSVVKLTPTFKAYNGIYDLVGTNEHGSC
jgi:DNA-binding LacI/PurR family transcriptional regulator